AVDLLPQTRRLDIEVIPGFHGELFERGAVEDAILVALQGGHLPSFRAWSVADEIVHRAASAWQEPRLPLAYFPSAKAAPSCR
ncbi:MAG TPA: hypothetical protein VFS62_15410, partial [Chloroflexota bacterium]|nr:hypothetical protein [Chloroflexota bacterium]